MNNDILTNLDNHIKRTNFWYYHNRAIGDWTNVISLLISAAIPFLIVLEQSYDVGSQRTLNFIVITISFLALILAILNNVIKFKQMSEINLEMNIKFKNLKMKYELGELNEEQIIRQMNKICKLERRL